MPHTLNFINVSQVHADYGCQKRVAMKKEKRLQSGWWILPGLILAAVVYILLIFL
jgi:hypothetical protein